MARRIEVLREVWRITERRDGFVVRSKYVEDRWVPIEDADLNSPRPDGDPDLVWVVKSDHTIQTIRSIVV